MSDRSCERCGGEVEQRLEVSDAPKPAVYIVTQRYCDDCTSLVEVSEEVRDG